ncbi:hypothetical protein COB52_03170 [Candidatus Kaiserbacteria bacterium]|nr:MAG: hypothetical protein COB52_03170 [Candidatus Kaiserbacteria bacterium]
MNLSRSSSQSTSVIIRASHDSESLEKIHTFSLKKNDLLEDSSTMSLKNISTMRTPSAKAFYVEEKVKVMDTHVMLSDGILRELTSQIIDF